MQIVRIYRVATGTGNGARIHNSATTTEIDSRMIYGSSIAAAGVRQLHNSSEKQNVCLMASVLLAIPKSDRNEARYSDAFMHFAHKIAFASSFEG